jgi:hypothetical protein
VDRSQQDLSWRFLIASVRQFDVNVVMIGTKSTFFLLRVADIQALILLSVTAIREAEAHTVQIKCPIRTK